METVSPPATNDTSCPKSTDSCASSCSHTPTKKRTEYKNRVNHFLYDNLNRVLCELYFYCEHESNAIQCSEVLNILSQASLQFHQLNRQLIVLSNANLKTTRAISWNVSSLSPKKDDFCKFNQNNFKSQNIASIKNIKTPTNNNNPNESENIKSNESENTIQNESKQQENTKPKSSENVIQNECKQPETMQQTNTKTQTEIEIMKTPPKKPKKTVKCWADYDSESDLEFESIKSDDEYAYEKYIKSDIRKNEIKKNDQVSKVNSNEIITNQNKNEIINITEKTEQKSEEIDIKNNKLESDQKSEEIGRENIIYKNKNQKWRQKSIENAIENTIQNKENISNISNCDVWFSEIKLNKKVNSKKHNFPLPFNKMVANTANTISNTISNPKSNINIGNRNSRNNSKIEKLIHKLSSKNRNINRNEQLKKTQLKQEKAEKRRLQLRKEQSNKWQIVAAKKKTKT